MSVLFRALLLIILFANCFGLANLIANQQGLQESFPGLKPWMLPALGGLSLASIAACLALWRWKRWGFGLIGAAYLGMLFINLGFGAPAEHTALGPLGLALLGLVTWPVRGRFGWGRPADRPADGNPAAEQ